MSSSRMIRTFGAPSGGRSGSIGGKRVSGSLASYVVRPMCGPIRNRQDRAGIFGHYTTSFSCELVKVISDFT